MKRTSSFAGAVGGAAPASFRIAIVGMGSRGLSVLEQLINLSAGLREVHFKIDVFDPGSPGAGLHDPEAPDYLMLNTMAGQLTAFSSAHPASQRPGQSFLQWCWSRDVRLDERGHVAEQGRAVAEGDFVPRRLLGRYLQDCYRALSRQCPAHLRLNHHAERVSDCQPLPDGAGWRLISASGWQQAFDAVFMTTGHLPRAVSPEPLGQRVAIEGLGLTAMDTLARLTEGRGGRFIRDSGFAGWRYQPSGHEPHIFMYSRSGLPFRARPCGAAGTPVRYPRLYFTEAALMALRSSRSGKQLDFRIDVLPLIEDEMSAVFYQSSTERAAPERLANVQHALRMAVTSPQRKSLFARLAEQWGAFVPGDWMPVDVWTGAKDDYAAWFREWIERDLALSRSGSASSPIKRALEVWRDDRSLLRLAVDRRGLTARSTQDFYSVWAGLSNRLVGGPQLERYEDLLALIDAGVVTVLAPGAERDLRFDKVICARVPESGLSGRRTGIFASLLDQGLIRAAHACPADGVETDRQGRAVRRDGTVNPRLWVLGPAVEGCTFYNHYVPTPDPACAAPLEARRAVESCLRSLTGISSTSRSRIPALQTLS